jgi:small subunit ribosomal protein S18
MPRRDKRDRDKKSDRDRGGRGDKGGPGGRRQKRKVCQFCKDKATWVDYKDTQLLRKYVSDRGKIRARRVTGTCAQHQADVATAVKNAREMALLPFAVR